MSACNAEPDDSSKEKPQPQSSIENPPNDPVSKYFKGYSSMVFLRRGKHKRKQSRSNLGNLSKELQGSEKKPLSVATKKCEVLGFEEVSNEFTCDSSLVESYHLNTTKEAKFSFRKLEDGTFVLETKTPSDPEKSGSGLKRSTKSRHKNGRYSHKPLKICFKKRSKALRKSSDSNDDYKSQNLNSPCDIEQGDITCAENSQDENTLNVQSTSKTWATFKRLITRRRKLHSSLKRQSQLSGRHLEVNGSGSSIQRTSQKKRFSNLRIPCMNFSRGKRSAKMDLPSEEPLCTAKSTEHSRNESEEDGNTNNNVQASISTPQNPLEVERRKTDSSPEIVTDICSNPHNNLNRKENEKCEINPPNAQLLLQSISSPEEIKCNSQQSQGKELEHQLKMDFERSSGSLAKGQDLKCAISNIPSIIITNGLLMDEDNSAQRDDTYSHTDSEEEMNGQFLVNGISTIVDQKSDLYEFLLMRTAASLVSKVLQSSIQQIVEEDTLLNHSPCRASERFYI
ncbi:A-kinase anchor protein 5 [Hyperolius riggenbachi]|uniref:A-kinase anchor protein 5 n=1 Tax=Hyperolius riggenbachi TaxID=752182 RepID=UPI0035A3CAF4